MGTQDVSTDYEGNAEQHSSQPLPPIPSHQPVSLVSPEEGMLEYLKPEIGGVRGKPLRFVSRFKLFRAGSGNNQYTIHEGTHCIIDPDSLEIGWKCWVGGSLIDSIVGKPHEGFVLPAENSLREIDQSYWETWADGKPKKPWQRHESVVMTDIKTGEIYVFLALSFNDRAALKNFFAECYADPERLRAEVPVVELTTKNDLPVLRLVGWVPNGKAPLPVPDDGSPFTSSPDEYAGADGHLNDKVPF